MLTRRPIASTLRSLEIEHGGNYKEALQTSHNRWRMGFREGLWLDWNY